MDRSAAPPHPADAPVSDLMLRALADPTRRKLLQLLLAEELNVTELVGILRLPQSTVSRHLRMLRSAGLAQDRRNGTTALYSAPQAREDAGRLRPILLAWLGTQPLPDALRGRLQKVLRTRADEAAGFFQRLGLRWDELRAEAFGEAFAFEAILALLPPGWTAVDIGTGTGYLLPALAAHFRRVVAVDPAPAMLECARQRARASGARNVTLHRGDLGRLPLRNRTCDLAIACLVLHHVPEPADALGEMHRILRPGGRILIVEQQAHENRAFHEMMQDHWPGFDPPAFARKVSAAGFHQVRYQALQTASRKPGSVESPCLFVLTGERSARP